jgi:hypothetical protein
MAGGLAGFAAELRAVADRAEAELAVEACRMGAREYLAVLQEVTPVLTGALRASEHVWRVTGGGESASAILGPNIIYDRFRNYGGTITRKKPPPAVLGNPSVGFFGHSVTQAGSHYMERAQGPGAAALAVACKVTADEIITLT